MMGGEGRKERKKGGRKEEERGEERGRKRDLCRWDNMNKERS